MTRRSFLGLLVGAAIARPSVLEWVAQASPSQVIAIAPLPVAGTYGAIERATFSFWRNQSPSSLPPDFEKRMRHLYNECQPL